MRRFWSTQAIAAIALSVATSAAAESLGRYDDVSRIAAEGRLATSESRPQPTAVPEPALMMLFGAGLMGLAAWRRRGRRD